VKALCGKKVYEDRKALAMVLKLYKTKELQQWGEQIYRKVKVIHK